MRMLPALVLVALSTVAASTGARAVEPAAAQSTVMAHVQLPDLSEYVVTLVRNGDAKLFARNGGESVEINLQLWDSRLRYEVKHSGAKIYQLEGQLPPTVGRPFTVGHFPQSGDVRLWLTER